MSADLYTEAEINAGIVAAGERGSCEHERSLRRSGVNIRCDRCDVIAALDAVAPLIAARALREFATDRVTTQTAARMREDLCDAADEIDPPTDPGEPS